MARGAGSSFPFDNPGKQLFGRSGVSVAARRPSAVAAVLAFSPGEYLASLQAGDEHSVKDAAAKVKAPVFVTCAQDSEEIAAARAIVQAVPGASGLAQATQFVPRRGGVHGSSTLRREKNPSGAGENWRAVEQFLAGLR